MRDTGKWFLRCILGWHPGGAPLLSATNSVYSFFDSESTSSIVVLESTISSCTISNIAALAGGQLEVLFVL